MVEFLDNFDVERGRVMDVLAHLETVWQRFQEQATLDAETGTDSLIASELQMARRDLDAAQFTVGVFGLIKRGKSTLLNALIGREVSSMHVTPETAVPVYVGYAERPQAVVHFADGRSEQCVVDEINHFTSQKFNPNNELGVTHVEQWVPVGFLRNGTRLIDTPGLDDAEADEVYTERTMQELDAVDAGIIVFLSPPTVGATEMGFLTDVMTQDLKKAFLICNMYPQHFHDPETRNAVLDYVGKRIVEACKRAGVRGVIRLYPVCALEAWTARQHDDIDAWKRSGADRVLRDLETHLSDEAGFRVLEDAADRVAKVAEMAQHEVEVRLQLLEDPDELSSHRGRLDAHIRELEAAFDYAVTGAGKEVEQLKLRIRGTVLRPFTTAKSTIENAESVADLDAFAKRFRREVEVAGEAASRQFAEGFQTVVARVRQHLEEHFQAVMSDLAPNIPHVKLTTSSLLSVPETVKDLDTTKTSGATSAVSGLAGGLAGGGALAYLAGSAAVVLGPIGLLGGALVGWKLSGELGKAGDLKRGREALTENLEGISAELLNDFDRQVKHALDTLAAAVARRRKAFAGDLYTQFDLVERLANDPGTVDQYRRDVAEFQPAFQAVADRAQGVLSRRV